MSRAVTWKTKDGRVVRVREMDDAHLMNTIAFLRRRAPLRALFLAMNAGRYSETAPDGAAMAAEQAETELLDLLDEGPDAILEQLEPAFPTMLREARRRKLEPRHADDDFSQSQSPDD